jgi:hypothetical protein
MAFARWTGALALLSFTALAAGACGDSNGDDSPGGAGASDQGDAGSAGKTASTAAAGAGGAAVDLCATEPDSEACREVPWCGPFAVTEFCGPTPFPLCPSSLANLVERTPCDTVTKLDSYDTTCGGQVLVRGYEDHTETWEFDDADVVANILVESGSLHTCYEGGRSFSWLYGSEPCKIDMASKVDVCPTKGGNGMGGAGAVDPGGMGGAGGVAAVETGGAP